MLFLSPKNGSIVLGYKDKSPKRHSAFLLRAKERLFRFVSAVSPCFHVSTREWYL